MGLETRQARRRPLSRREGYLAGTGLIDRIRRNHGLEHGTIAILLERGVRPPLAGYGAAGGFFIYGDVSTEQLRSAVDEARRRMSGGQRELAVSRFCGTNMAVGVLLAALVVGLLGRRQRSKRSKVPMMALGVVGSLWARRPLGNALQRHFTTLPDPERLDVTGIRRIQMGRRTIHRVTTRAID